MDWVEDVLEFHRAFDLVCNESPTIPSMESRMLRHELVGEEVLELSVAMINEDLPDIADSCADLIYVVIGTAITYGIDLRPVWEEVHKANMAKVGGHKRADGKWLKPEGWRPPDIDSALTRGRLGE